MGLTLTWNPRETKPPKVTNNAKRFYFEFDDWEFELEWYFGGTSDSNVSYIRPYHEQFSTEDPEWFPSPWPRFNELIEPATALWLLEVAKDNYEAGVREGHRRRIEQINKALGL